MRILLKTIALMALAMPVMAQNVPQQFEAVAPQNIPLVAGLTQQTQEKTFTVV